MDYQDYRHLLFEHRQNGVLLITINRPEVYNATNARLHLELAEIWRTVAKDEATKAVVITGAGKAFSAGGDLTMVTSNLDDITGVLRTGEEARSIVYNLLDLDKPVVSAINGVAVGAGLAVALTADISIMADTARFTDGHTRLGVASGDHAVMLWPLLCGMAKAKYYLLTSDFIDGTEAERIGLVSKCVPHAEVLDRALQVADRLAAGSQPSLRWTKRALNHWYKSAAPAFELSVVMEMFNFVERHDVEEGLTAIREKREPRFPSGEPEVSTGVSG
ncbi:enoyl-CoA hydratase/isomerase family protein [Streptomyces sp. NPDC005820]|uniref:enoyl-CoA hydratase/isomerase family protein n=1 Tax=Streptomyces sp. NPDC005820 TaxID=3157069 RepID=UPI0033E17112